MKIPLEQRYDIETLRLRERVNKVIPKAAAEARSWRTTKDTRTQCPNCFQRKGPSSDLCQACHRKLYYSQKAAARKADDAGVRLNRVVGNPKRDWDGSVIGPLETRKP